MICLHCGEPLSAALGYGVVARPNLPALYIHPGCVAVAFVNGTTVGPGGLTVHPLAQVAAIRELLATTPVLREG